MTDEEIIKLAHRSAWKYKFSSDPHHSDTYTFNKTCMIDFARKLLFDDKPLKPRIDIEEVKRLVDEVSNTAFQEGVGGGLAKNSQIAYDNLINYIQERI